VSLNKRSLRKKARAEPSLEDQLVGHERALKSRRGSNRRSSFDAIRVHDEERAIGAVLAILDGTSGANREELGALLVSTGQQRFLDAALRGKYGVVDLRAHAPEGTLAPFVDDFLAHLYAFTPVEAERKARMLAHDPRVIAAVLDDARFDARCKRDVGERALADAPEIVWQHRDLFDDALAIAAGLACNGIGAFDVAAFARSLASLSPSSRALRWRHAKLPGSALRLAPHTSVALFTLALDDAALDENLRTAVAQTLAGMDLDEARDALLARPRVHPPATILACRRLSADEAHDVIAPLLRESEAARDAFLASKHVREAIFLDVIVALLAIDFVRARAMLQQNGAPRAREELARLSK
jgi:hypothetical protein